LRQNEGRGERKNEKEKEYKKIIIRLLHMIVISILMCIYYIHVLETPLADYYKI